MPGLRGVLRGWRPRAARAARLIAAAVLTGAAVVLLILDAVLRVLGPVARLGLGGTRSHQTLGDDGGDGGDS
ncbi:hypothetical protein ABZ612_26850 [Streptomyces avermitilis]|uniref:hypothetical protein n=1 Tax=Streptomyces avermitilis TaxID=33903 RepID=UPI0033F0B6A3